MKQKLGFSLFELTITLVIIGILGSHFFSVYRNYQDYLSKEQASMALYSLANFMEQYRFKHHTYKGATVPAHLANLDEIRKFYRLKIDAVYDDSYILKAIPKKASGKPLVLDHQHLLTPH